MLFSISFQFAWLFSCSDSFGSSILPPDSSLPDFSEPCLSTGFLLIFRKIQAFCRLLPPDFFILLPLSPCPPSLFSDSDFFLVLSFFSDSAPSDSDCCIPSVLLSSRFFRKTRVAYSPIYSSIFSSMDSTHGEHTFPPALRFPWNSQPVSKRFGALKYEQKPFCTRSCLPSG